MNWLLREVCEYEPLPRGYGVAIYHPHRRSALCAPLGLSRLLNILNRGYQWLCSSRPGVLDNAYTDGYVAGRREAQVAQSHAEDIAMRKLIALARQA
jgi:hypothetical protein